MSCVSNNLNLNTQPNTWMPSNLGDFQLSTIYELAQQAIEASLPDINHSKLDEEGHKNCLATCCLYGKAALGCILACNKAFSEGSLSSYQISLLR